MTEFDATAQIDLDDANLAPIKQQIAERLAARRARAVAQGLAYDHLTDTPTRLPGTHADAHDLVHDPHIPGVVWYCNDGGIYRYEEFGETWTDYSNGLAITQFYRIDVSQIGELKLMAGSQDNGGWLRTQSASTRWPKPGASGSCPVAVIRIRWIPPSCS